MSPNRNVPLLTISLFHNNILRDVFYSRRFFFLFYFFFWFCILSQILLYTLYCVEFSPHHKNIHCIDIVCRFFFGFPPLYCRSRFGRLNSIAHTTGNKQSTLIPPATRSLKKTSLLFRRHLTSLFPSHFKFNSFTEPVLEDTLFFCFVSL